MRETWYVLEDGTAVHPGEVAPNEDGRLAHKSGLVAMRDDGETPRSRGVDVDEPEAEKQPTAEESQAAADKKAADDKAAADKAAADAAAAAAGTNSQMTPQPQPKPVPRQGYKTRGAKGKARK